MKLNIIVFKNAKINAFTTPNFVDLDPEVAAVQLQRAIQLHAEDNQFVNNYKNLDMYTIGTFDDVTGNIEMIPAKFLCSPRELILSMVDVKKEEKKEEVASV